MTNEEFIARKQEIDSAWQVRNAAIQANYADGKAAGVSAAIATWNTAHSANEARRVADFMRAGMRWVAEYSYTISVTARDKEHADGLAYEMMEENLRNGMNRSDFSGTFKVQNHLQR